MSLLQRTKSVSAAKFRVSAYSATATRFRAGPVVKVSFNLPYKCRFGQNLYLVGAGEALGNWDVHEALELKWNPGDVWSGEIAVVDSDNVDLEYKYLVREKDGHVTSWAPGGNFSVQVPVVHDEGKPAGRIDVKDVWDQAWRDIQVVFNEAMAAGKDTCARSNEPATAAHDSACTSANAASPAAAAMAKYAAMLSAGTADELALLQASMDRALGHLSGTMDVTEGLLELVKDPADPAVLEMDKRVAASFNRVMALSKAITATANEPLRLPGSKQ